MIDPRCQPIAHHPPLKPISLRPTYPHAQTESRTFWEIQYEESIRIERGLRNEKMWRAVVEFAQTRGGGPFPATQSNADALNESEAMVTADEAQNEPAAECGALEDDRNSTGQSAAKLMGWVWHRGRWRMRDEAMQEIAAELASPENELGGVGLDCKQEGE